MNKQTVTQRGAHRVRLGLAAAGVAGASVVGLGVVAGAQAYAGTLGGPTVLKCGSTVALSHTYGYTFDTSTDRVIGLSGSGCSTNRNPVKISISANVDGTSFGVWTTTVTPSPGILNPFSFSNPSAWSVLGGGYLTAAAAAAAAGGHTYCVSPETVTFEASQAATEATSSVSFTLYTYNTPQCAPK